MSSTEVADVSPTELLDLLGRETDGSDVTVEELEALLRSPHVSTSTKSRVVGYVARLKKRAARALGQGDPKAEVLVRPAHRGRITGYSMACLGCGLVAQRLAPTKRLGELGAIGHLRTDHDGAGVVDVL